jgi:hypothetical protein
VEERHALMRGAPVWGLALVLVLLGIAVWRSAPPAANLDEDVDPRVFSTGRALATLRALDPRGEPQPVGSEAHTAVRERLIAQLAALGLSPQVQAAWSCRPGVVCAPVHNVVTRIEGRRDGPAVMVSAHYDTVHAAPGAGDNMHGVAILVEIARALTAAGPPLHPVVLLATDAEEQGLLGARAFVDEHDLSSRIAAVVNVDARGTRGRSNMFETSRGNGPLVELYARAVASASATSLADEVYRRMPNDTDFTVFERAGMRGLNFAFIGGVEHYHTELDRIEHLSARSVQHQGESVLAVTLALTQADLDTLDGADAAYCDVLGWFLVRWPAAAGVPIMVALGLGWLGTVVRLRSRRDVSVRDIVSGAVIAIAVLGLVPVLAHGVDRLIVLLARHPTPWGAYPLAHRCALWSVALAVGIVGGAVVGRRVGVWGLACGGWIVVVAFGTVVVWLAPGASPQFALPAAAGIAGLWLGTVVSGARRVIVGVLLPLAVTAVVWLPLALALEEAFGFAIPAVAILPLAISALVWAPTAAASVHGSRRLLWGAVGTLVLAIAAASMVEPYSPSRPRRLNVLHHTDFDSGEAFVAVGPGTQPPPHAMLRLANFQEGARASLPWSDEPYWMAPAVPVAADAPTVEILADHEGVHGRRLRLRLVSTRAADRLMVLLSPDTEVDAAIVEGQRSSRADLRQRWRGRRGILVFGVPAHGVELELELASGAHVDLEVLDIGVSMPAAIRPLVEARGERAVQSQWGDATSVSRRFVL